MFKSTKTHWEWTAVAEAEAKRLNVESRKAGQTLMQRDMSGAWVKRLTVPQSWVNKGYVQEAAAEQINLF